MSDPSSCTWFHGRITRDLAEKSLANTSMVDGTYLLRESTSVIGSYVLSVVKDRKVVHYQIQKQQNGMVGINEGPKFPGPVELVNHHKTHLDGLMSKLTVSCDRPAGKKAIAYNDISYEDLDEATRTALKSEGVDHEDAVRRFKLEIECVVGNILHRKQPWFHGIIPRIEADRRLESLECQEGMFLIRERGSPRGSYVLGICHNQKVNHYLFEPNEKGQLCIKAGRPFDNLMAVVNFYSQKSEGLLCTLKLPCEVSLFEFRPKFESYKNMLLHPEIQKELQKTLRKSEAELKKYRRISQLDKMKQLPPRPPVPRPISVPEDNEPWKFEKIYDSANVIKMEGFTSPFQNRNRDIKLDPNKLELQEEIGHGNFGSVMKGIFTLANNQKISVAVKTLKEEDIPSQRSEILSEADIMAKLDHPNIVRLVGVTHHPNFYIVMELAPQGPLHRYLKKHRQMPILNVLILMLQVDEGMHYLETQHFVHRDLAARNVLVVSENFVKISDFGMSRAMGAGNEYYRAERAGKWPLKWYAPECIYYHKFTSKGDVWSYGITMWEATSYGQKPYQKMNGQAIVESLESGYRLPRPERCPDDIYKLMRKCWEKREEDRPTFSEIGLLLSKYIEAQRIQ